MADSVIHASLHHRMDHNLHTIVFFSKISWSDCVLPPVWIQNNRTKTGCKLFIIIISKCNSDDRAVKNKSKHESMFFSLSFLPKICINTSLIILSSPWSSRSDHFFLHPCFSSCGKGCFKIKTIQQSSSRGLSSLEIECIKAEISHFERSWFIPSSFPSTSHLFNH